MFRILIVLFCALWLTNPSVAQTSMAALFEKTSYDFGTVPRGAKRVHAFTVTNRTQQPLHILSIRIPCNCVSAWATTKDLAPGASTTIVAELDTRRFGGALTKYCYVLFDQPREEVQLTVRALSHDGLFFTPDTLAFGKVKHGESAARTIRVSLTDPRVGGPFQAVAESPYVQAKIEDIDVAPGHATFRLTASLLPDLPVGDWASTIVLRAHDPGLAPMQVPLTVTVDR